MSKSRTWFIETDEGRIVKQANEANSDLMRAFQEFVVFCQEQFKNANPYECRFTGERRGFTLEAFNTTFLLRYKGPVAAKKLRDDKTVFIGMLYTFEGGQDDPPDILWSTIFDADGNLYQTLSDGMDLNPRPAEEASLSSGNILDELVVTTLSRHLDNIHKEAAQLLGDH
ncbi:MAG: hypothetical protein C0616_13540 [Desulfuromonas sp.]|nr:MAG: hypothetical protein C0616_13540 [Desulfuromonas sp.]